MLLDGANALIYGGGGVVGSRLAVALARDGARVHLAGRSRTKMQHVVDSIRADGGHAEAAVIDVLDEVDVDEYVDVVAACSGSIDVSIDVIVPGRVSRVIHPEASSRRLDRTEVADLERPVLDALRAHFITARAAARHMVCQHSGLILVPRCLSAAGSTGLDASSLASVVIDRLAAQLAGDLVSTGVRVTAVDTDPTSADETARRLVAAASDGDT
ncbi:SDR family NAD(P)-dependent oxidoreductase [Rhodococcus sp. BP-349]|uniref:SDR family NAD(P)-dependent oxidoreductase n=1 Tax=unclassified Rhodococcus (in: high G+C Gram-positive bacteria) TaxID=192944 RepID=UPI001C9A9BF8|nr:MULTISPECIES: SDR family NAD(P)-dependent oxidoreductase [unclassified Rhodococcus (in: high G+C Gram-positive bacteria)]MBY6540539.1 SDR family NAD(P)-dependent oxidoreductase [Rhodococcus sp. BP-363]MBY6545436.1 SDR family NAD(P)-dependent oxidoreductase [Rhodococcus sp. BP-369]MBY6564666.1 SDR family NAD(P)-dependent oxidoreductase [Rhodococcus sp. BP-370]MBY6578398.1 SDR family NAD(P)-dependent oxidoreductase [Rhodococcus sp. BP-364]MBY6587699.1 SDR family NAD(P)-dependent oxidoreductas